MLSMAGWEQGTGAGSALSSPFVVVCKNRFHNSTNSLCSNIISFSKQDLVKV